MSAGGAWGEGAPEPAIRRERWRVSLVWIVPALAALIGLWLVVEQRLQQGPELTIRFRTAEGIEPGKTRIRYKDVDIGAVERVTLAPDRTQVIVHARLDRDARSMLVGDTQFWVVRPRISTTGVTGLGTLLSGAYIGVEAGHSTEARRDFTGLEIPPIVTTGLPGRQFILHGSGLGSLAVGSPVFFRRIEVGRIAAYALDRDGNGVTFTIFIDAPYDAYVTSSVRFWHASGIDVVLDSGGVRVHTESIATLVEGGIAFQAPQDEPGQAEAPPGTAFLLYPDRDAAMRVPDTEVRRFTAYFGESLRGLSSGAPVEFHGIPIGEVESLGVEYDRNGLVRFPVALDVYPNRLRARSVAGAATPGSGDAAFHELVDGLTRHGLRAQLKTGNLLTGQLYVALDFHPEAAAAAVDWTRTPPVLPSVGGGLEEIQETVARLLHKLDRVPIDAIAADARATLQRLDTTVADADALIKRLDADVAPQAAATLQEARRAAESARRLLDADAPLQEDVREALRELQRSARAVTTLSETLDRHPEALLRGRPREEK
ncbi:MAG TPA: MlaD family protein [Burkholderiaceae bacterium]|nr:MlaD family protein [Burkholderiaceae bacterium]